MPSSSAVTGLADARNQLSGGQLKFDEIGYWSELKLEIIQSYAQRYSTILSRQTNPRLKHVYIDGFSGAGKHISKTTGEVVPGSPLNAVNLDPPFEEYYLVDLDGDKVEHLRSLVGDHGNVHVLEGDCNELLLQQVFPNVLWENYRRGLCLLDPYSLQLDWEVMAEAGRMKSIEIFLNFPIYDMNRNVLWRDSEGSSPKQRARMTRFWGDESWTQVVYKPASQLNLFGEPETEKQTNDAVVEAFRTRLKEVAGFKHVPPPIPMRNTTGAVVYYLFFASHNPVARKIVSHIFDRFRDRRS